MTLRHGNHKKAERSGLSSSFPVLDGQKNVCASLQHCNYSTKPLVSRLPPSRPEYPTLPLGPCGPTTESPLSPLGPNNPGGPRGPRKQVAFDPAASTCLHSTCVGVSKAEMSTAHGLLHTVKGKNMSGQTDFPPLETVLMHAI